MTDAADEPRVVDVPDARRYEARVGGAVAGFAEYRRSSGRITFIHTVVAPEFEGRGVGSRLARVALDAARAEGLRVTPRCPFFRAYIDRHPEYADLVGSATA